MKRNAIQINLESFVNSLPVPENDKLKMHPSLAKGHQTMEIFEEKMNVMLQKITIPPKLISDSYLYYLSKGELNDYLNLEVGSMFLTGPVHSGKTVYLVSRYIIATIIAASYPPNKIRLIYVEYANLINDFKEAISRKEVEQGTLFKIYWEAHILFIDDIFSNGMTTEYAINILYTIIDYRHLHNLPTLITTNLTEANILEMDNGERLLRRLMEHAEILTFTTKL